MYAQITVTASYDAGALCQALNAQLGPARTAPEEALKDTVFASSAQTVAPTVVAAQSIRKSVIILYFFDGPDTISIHVTATTLAELKAHAKRVTRQLLAALGKGAESVEATIFVETIEGSSTAISKGCRISLIRQLVGNAGEKWISKLLVPAIIFTITSMLLAGTPSAISAMIGLLAALLGFLVELTLFAYYGTEWLWEEAS